MWHKKRHWYSKLSSCDCRNKMPPETEHARPSCQAADSSDMQFSDHFFCKLNRRGHHLLLSSEVQMYGTRQHGQNRPNLCSSILPWTIRNFNTPISSNALTSVYNTSKHTLKTRATEDIHVMQSNIVKWSAASGNTNKNPIDERKKW